MSILGVYNPYELEFDHGDGVYLYTSDGTRYLDFTSGIGVMSLGYSHPGLVNALKNQAEKIWHCSNLFTINGQITVAERIAKNSFADSVFFCNSGAEAVESGIKAVRKYYYEKNEQKFKIICTNNSFHGRTFGAISACGKSSMINGFEPVLEGFIQVDFNDFNQIRKVVDHNTAAILIETVQGEGGITPAKKSYLRDLNTLAADNDILLFFDEVQCGVGRTGKFLATEWVEELRPNLVAIAKGIGGGFPLGALLLDKKTANAMKPGSHGSTFGGNPLGMAVANEVLNHVLREDFLDHIRYVGYNLRQRIKKDIISKFPNIVTEVRGIGLMIGLQAKIKNSRLIEAMKKQRLLTVKAGLNVIRMLPPLTLEEKHVDEAIEKIDKAFTYFKNEK